jgi:hypothetical protein
VLNSPEVIDIPMTPLPPAPEVFVPSTPVPSGLALTPWTPVVLPLVADATPLTPTAPLPELALTPCTPIVFPVALVALPLTPVPDELVVYP